MTSLRSLFPHLYKMGGSGWKTVPRSKEGFGNLSTLSRRTASWKAEFQWYQALAPSQNLPVPGTEAGNSLFPPT